MRGHRQSPLAQSILPHSFLFWSSAWLLSCQCCGHVQHQVHNPTQAWPTHPNADLDGVEYSQEQEAPCNAINDDPFSCIEELIDNNTKKKQVDDRPLGGWNNQQVN